MKSYPTLPQGYCHTPAAAIDLVHNKKQFWIVNGLSVVLCVIMLILPFLWGGRCGILSGRTRFLRCCSGSSPWRGYSPTLPCTS